VTAWSISGSSPGSIRPSATLSGIRLPTSSPTAPAPANAQSSSTISSPGPAAGDQVHRPDVQVAGGLREGLGDGQQLVAPLPQPPEPRPDLGRPDGRRQRVIPRHRLADRLAGHVLAQPAPRQPRGGRGRGRPSRPGPGRAARRTRPAGSPASGHRAARRRPPATARPRRPGLDHRQQPGSAQSGVAVHALREAALVGQDFAAPGVPVVATVAGRPGAVAAARGRGQLDHGPAGRSPDPPDPAGGLVAGVVGQLPGAEGRAAPGRRRRSRRIGSVSDGWMAAMQ
jgi:hypothetical protein